MKHFKEAMRRGLLGLITALFLSHTLFFITALKQSTLTVESSFFISHYITYGLSGFYFAAISVIFQMKLQLKSRYIIHLLATAPILPIAHWIGLMPNTTLGRTIFFTGYVSSYIFSMIIYTFYRKK